MDKQVDSGNILGFAGAYNNTHVSFSDHHAGADVNTLRVGPYLTRFDDDCFVDASVTAGFHDNDLDGSSQIGQVLSLAHGSCHARDLSFYLGGGHFNSCDVGLVVQF